jgi:hypothetical protein
MRISRTKKFVATSAIAAGILLGVGTGPAGAEDIVIDASSFATSLCGDAAFSTAEDDGVHVVINFQDGAGPFGGGSYDCATGELTIK